MGFIKNYKSLATSEGRKTVLALIETGLSSIQPENIITKNITTSGNLFKVQNRSFDLSHFDRVFLLGFGKGSAGISKIIESILGEHLTGGFVIDVRAENFKKIEFILGTHPLPSQQNLDFTNKVINSFGKLNERDLVIIITCGGGSALFEAPNSLTVDQIIEVNKALLKSGANIHDMNVVRKHFSKVKGGGLAAIIYPATVANLIFSDVPGNDLSVIASAPTVVDPSTIDDAWKIYHQYGLDEKLLFDAVDFVETPKEGKYFEKISNIMVLSNLTAIVAMAEKAKEFKLNTLVYKDNFQAMATDAAKELVGACPPHSILLAGGETTVTVIGSGKGGRNQEVVLAGLEYLSDDTIITSFTSDGWDNTEFAGAIGDVKTLSEAKALNLDPKVFLNSNDSFNFFKKTGDGIETGRLPSNVSDLFIVFKK